jgi:hypothetical protein
MSEAVARVLGCFSQGEEIHRITLRHNAALLIIG